MFSLGGLDENGKNMFVIEVDKNIFVFEAGLKYADELTLGIDYIIHNVTYLKENKKQSVVQFYEYIVAYFKDYKKNL